MDLLVLREKSFKIKLALGKNKNCIFESFNSFRFNETFDKIREIKSKFFDYFLELQSFIA